MTQRTVDPKELIALETFNIFHYWKWGQRTHKPLTNRNNQKEANNRKEVQKEGNSWSKAAQSKHRHMIEPDINSTLLAFKTISLSVGASSSTPSSSSFSGQNRHQQSHFDEGQAIYSTKRITQTHILRPNIIRKCFLSIITVYQNYVCNQSLCVKHMFTTVYCKLCAAAHLCAMQDFRCAARGT